MGENAEQWRYEFQVVGDAHWRGNAMTYDTETEAANAAKRKFNAWTMALAWRVVPVGYPRNEEVTS